MRSRIIVAVFTVIALTSGALPSQAGDIIDRIIARVNGRTIFMSDWDEELCFEAFVDGRSPGQFTSDQRRAALDRLIDQELLRQQLRLLDTLPADAETVRKRVAEIRSAHPGAGTDAGWKSVLARYGLTEIEVFRRVSYQLNLMQSVDARLRPSVQIDSSSVEAYYQDKFAKASRPGTQLPLPEVAGKIKELLTEQRLNELLVSWLQTLRTEGDIHTTTPAATSSEGRAQ